MTYTLHLLHHDGTTSALVGFSAGIGASPGTDTCAPSAIPPRRAQIRLLVCTRSPLIPRLDAMKYEICFSHLRYRRTGQQQRKDYAENVEMLHFKIVLNSLLSKYYQMMIQYLILLRSLSEKVIPEE